MAGRHADIWNSSLKGDDDWRRKCDIVAEAAAASGRDPEAIMPSTTVERPLPESDADSEQLLELLAHHHGLGVRYFVMDFGHPETPEPIARFVEQVMTPLRQL